MSESLYVAVTGYYSTGSSALIDLLKEYDDVAIASPVRGDYEHMAFFSHGALYDLSAILLNPSCSVYNSDMAINGFIDAAKRLNDNDFGWFGSYKKYYGDSFMEITMRFVEAISKKKDRRSAAHIEKVRFSFVKAALQLAAKVCYKRPITKLGRKYVYDANCGYYSMPSKETFCEAAKRYTKDYMEMCAKEARINVFDHLVWPQQSNSITDFMPENFKVIVLDRDPRDVYLLNKYYWHKPPVSTAKPYYPTDCKEFCEEWKNTIQKRQSTEKILYLHFEDMIYRYDETVERVEAFLGLSEKKHVKKKTTFKPDSSIENTQVYLVNKEWEEEIKFMYDSISEYFYDFPYERIPDRKLWFDTELQLVGKKTK